MFNFQLQLNQLHIVYMFVHALIIFVDKFIVLLCLIQSVKELFRAHVLCYYVYMKPDFK